MEKRQLVKLALAALVIASSAPSGALVANETQADGILLAAGCSGGKCGSSKNNQLSDNTTPSGNSSYSTSNSYQTGTGINAGSDYKANSSYGGAGNYNSTSSANDRGNNSSSTRSGYGNQAGFEASTYANPPSSSTYSSSSYGGTTGNSGEPQEIWKTDANRGESVNWNSNRTYGTDTDRGYQSTTHYHESYFSPHTTVYGTGAAATSNLSDEEFRKQLSPDFKRTFDSLDRTGKDLAKSLANNPSFADKNAAVREAQRRTEGGSSSTTTYTR